MSFLNIVGGVGGAVSSIFNNETEASGGASGIFGQMFNLIGSFFDRDGNEIPAIAAESGDGEGDDSGDSWLSTGLDLVSTFGPMFGPWGAAAGAAASVAGEFVE